MLSSVCYEVCACCCPGGPEYYQCALPAMIDGWRQVFKVPDAFFGIFQLAAYPSSNDTKLPAIRDVQFNVSQTVSNVGLAAAYDLGDLYSPMGAIHPRTKVSLPSHPCLASLRVPCTCEFARAGCKLSSDGSCDGIQCVWCEHHAQWTNVRVCCPRHWTVRDGVCRRKLCYMDVYVCM